MQQIHQDYFLWSLLLLLLAGVFALAICDPSLRVQTLDFAKVALGGLLGIITAKSTTITR
jgi:hypothetical protein